MYVEFLMDINSEVDRMTDIINDLLTLVRMNREEVHLNPMEINLTDMISDIVRRLEPIAKSKNINLNYNKLKAVKAEIEETKFSLAVSNLIENAIKYNNDGGNVEVTVDADNQNAFVTIADDGVGIAEEELGKIFDRFYRGTGLGLSIARSAVLMHNGTIKVSSKENEGTTFVIIIPLKQE